MDASSITEFQRARLKRESQEKENTAITAYTFYYGIHTRSSEYKLTGDQ